MGRRNDQIGITAGEKKMTEEPKPFLVKDKHGNIIRLGITPKIYADFIANSTIKGETA